MKSKNNRPWLILLLIAVVFFLAAGYYFLILPIQQSKQLEQTLIKQFGWANRYTPPANGYIKPDRVEAFLRVREAVQANCDTFQGILDSVIRLEAIESDPELSASDKASEGFQSLKNMFGAAPAFLEFMDARNHALLEAEMGLGEYLYIYLASYGPQLGNEPNARYADQEDAYISRRSHDEYLQVLRNQLDALHLAGEDSSHPDLNATLQNEIDRLKNSPENSPWPGGPPPLTRESLLPYQARIDGLYCEGIVRVELLQKNRGLNFEG